MSVNRIATLAQAREKWKKKIAKRVARQTNNDACLSQYIESSLQPITPSSLSEQPVITVREFTTDATSHHVLRYVLGPGIVSFLEENGLDLFLFL